MGKTFALVCTAIAVAALPASAQTRFFSGEITAGTITAESRGVAGGIHVKAGKESFVYYELRRIIYSFNAP